MKPSNFSFSFEAVKGLLESSSLSEWTAIASREIIRNTEPRRALIILREGSKNFPVDPVEWHDEELPEISAAIFERFLQLHAHIPIETKINYKLEDAGPLAEVVDKLGHKGFNSLEIEIDDEFKLLVAVFDSDRALDNNFGDFLLTLRKLLPTDSVQASIKLTRYERLVEQSDAIILSSNAANEVVFMSRPALDFFGLAAEEISNPQKLQWLDLLHSEDRNSLKSWLLRLERKPEPIDEEVRVLHRKSGKPKWLLLRLIPVFAPDGTLQGWDGFGIDISERREAQESLNLQSKGMRALYTVSSAIRGYLDPPSISLRGIAALCDATGAEAGICYLYPPKQQPMANEVEWDNIEVPSQSLEPIAQYGFGAELSVQDEVLRGLSSLAQYVGETGKSLVISDLRNDPRCDTALANQNELGCVTLVPIAVEGSILGVVSLVSRKLNQFDGSSVMLTSAAASQIGLAARQANLFSLYKKQTKYLSAMYRMSHELSQHFDLEPLFQNAFSIIREELGLKRLWLGLLNETGTKLDGQAAYGPGWRRRLIDVSVDVSRATHALGKVVSTKRPMVIKQSDELMKEFGVSQLFTRMAIHSVAIVPVMASGDVIGVLAVQPGANEPGFHPDQLHLLVSLADEIGVNVRTIRLLSQNQESEKMRTSGLLAAGIAHNFNNSLQAILGQASLLEIQNSNPERVLRAAKMINAAATKSAGLVKQLLTFTQFEEPRKELIDINDLLERNRETFARLLSSKNSIHFEFGAKMAPTLIDRSQLSRVFGALLQNAMEAMPVGGKVFITTDTVEFGDDRSVLEIPPGKYVRIEVKDTGVGMTEENKKRCFEPFFTTKNADPGSGLGLNGSGLGLAAAYALVRRNNGRILVDSELGVGTTFSLYFPIAATTDQITSAAHDKELEIEKIRTGETNGKPLSTPGTTSASVTTVRSGSN